MAFLIPMLYKVLGKSAIGLANYLVGEGAVLLKDVPGKKHTNVQSIIFDKKMFTVAKAQKWLRNNKFKYTKVDKKLHTLRFRQIDPKVFKRFRTKKIANGISFVIGFKK